MRTKETAYLFARLSMGVNFLLHGLVRFPKLQGFKDWMLGYFKDSLLPLWSVEIWASILPFLEFGIGLLLIIGLCTKKTIIFGSSVIIVLIIGSCLKENWEWVSFQMIYSLYFFLLLIYYKYNHYSIDRYIKKDKE